MRSRTETGPRTVGLDKPCRDCGQTIYYGYKGPIEGLCGRCADKRLKSRTHTKTRTLVRETEGMSAVAHTALIVLAFAAGAAAMYFAYPHLP